ncbi:diguanylate cyclase domain-containing protein [Novosphingobium sp.]|uniref:diguanylate cyclase domain-containing protein n=1 Tax=Novosphingobium sp. TaxID=1874826 RepID=UPI0035B1646A
MRWPPRFLTRFWPRVPLSVRDAYALSQYAQLARQLPLLYAALILIVFAAMTAADHGAAWVVRHGVPGATALLFASRLVTWLRRSPTCACADTARMLLRRTRRIAGSVATVSSVWCIHSWANAPRETAMYFPLFMAMGAFATITCLAVSRSAALVGIATGMLPMTLALLLAGDPINLAAGVSIATTCGFLVALLHKQHARTIDLLVLQNRMRRLAETDPLTGLANRRGLHDRLATLLAKASDSGGGPALALIDLDGFKPVNDRHAPARKCLHPSQPCIWR